MFIEIQWSNNYRLAYSFPFLTMLEESKVYLHYTHKNIA